MVTDFDYVIVGGGPAGLSTWLFLHQIAPELAERTVLIEKETYPRKKLCGGGISSPGRSILSRLSFSLNFDHVPIDLLKIRLRDKELTIDAPKGFAVVDRQVFDHELAKEAVSRGLNLREDESFVDFLRLNDDEVLVTTTRETYRVKALVGADGAKSKVRRCLTSKNVSHNCRLLETYGIRKQSSNHADRGIAIFDFSQVFSAGLQGYIWKFPCIHDGQPAYNAGVFDSQTYVHQENPSIKKLLSEHLLEHDDTFESRFQSHPMQTFSIDGVFSEPNILLVGDAAGVEPALGEGISVSLAYGEVAANALLHGYHRYDYSFKDYKVLLIRYKLGIYMQSQRKWAEKLYHRTASNAEFEAFFTGAG